MKRINKYEIEQEETKKSQSKRQNHRGQNHENVNARSGCTETVLNNSTRQFYTFPLLPSFPSVQFVLLLSAMLECTAPYTHVVDESDLNRSVGSAIMWPICS